MSIRIFLIYTDSVVHGIMQEMELAPAFIQSQSPIDSLIMLQL